MNPATGPKSVSFKLSAAGILTGLGTLLTGLLHNPNTVSNGVNAVTDVRAAIGAALVAISVAAKLFHDNGFNKATIAAAGSELASELPNIKADLGKAAGLVESDFPALKNAFDNFHADVIQHLQGVDSRIGGLTGLTPQMVEDAVRKILAGVPPVVPPATPPVAPPTA